jgi:hypothetical protein
LGVPDEFDVDVKIEPPLPPVTVAGIPDTFHIHLEELPKIQLGVDPLDIKAKLEPLELSLRLKELPSRRTHLPANFSVGLSLLGFELMNVTLCGEGQLISEPYEPNPCEICGGRPKKPAWVPEDRSPPPVKKEDEIPEPH